MILSGDEIYKHYLSKDICIDPFDPNKINSNSYNLTLAPELVVYTNDILDMKINNPHSNLIKIPEEGYLLEPGKLYLGRTNEWTNTRNLVPMLEGRSSIGRLGLYIHVTAGFGDEGFKGYWTLELHCVQPLRIYPNVEICQIYYHTMLGTNKEYGKPYSGKYHRNKGIQTSKIWKEFEK